MPSSKIKGATNAKDIAFRLIDEANVGLAPGSAFGEAGEGYLRLCYLRKPEDVEEAVRRIARGPAAARGLSPSARYGGGITPFFRMKQP